MTRKNIKVPEALFLALRDDKPDNVTWPNYLEARCLGGEGVSQTSPDAEEIAREVAKKIDYAQLSNAVAEDVVGELRG